jgi:hypothetical protein
LQVYLVRDFEQIVAKETKYPNSPTINTTTVFFINGLSDYFLELKSLSNYTKEDSIEVERIWRASDTRVEAKIVGCFCQKAFW